MKRVINGKMYNTETAKELCYWSNNLPMSDFNYCKEILFKKKTGEFFLYGDGGAMSKYAECCSQNTWSGGDSIIPLSESEAREWVERTQTGDTYVEVFGEVEE